MRVGRDIGEEAVRSLRVIDAARKVGIAVAEHKERHVEHHVVARYLPENIFGKCYPRGFILYDCERREAGIVHDCVAPFRGTVQCDSDFVREQPGGVALFCNKICRETLPYPLLGRGGDEAAAERVEQETLPFLLLYAWEYGRQIDSGHGCRNKNPGKYKTISAFL